MANDALVITRAGARSLHPGWVEGGERCFDLLVSAYAADTPRIEGPGIITAPIPGSKVAGYAATFRAFADLIARYRYVALLDDDLETDAASLSRCFALGRDHGLRLWQPSLTWDSYFTYAALLRQPQFRLRYVNFIEMMCPFFEASHLAAITPLFAMGYETGIDRVWHRSAEPAWHKLAVIDAVAVRHTRPVGRDKTMNGFGAEEQYDDKVAEVAARFDEHYRGVIAYAGLTAGGHRVDGRLRMALSAARLMAHIGDSPVPPRYYRRALADHVRHTVLRSPNLAARPLDLSSHAS